MNNIQLTTNERVIHQLLCESYGEWRRSELQEAAYRSPEWRFDCKPQFERAIVHLLKIGLIMTRARGRQPWRKRSFIASCHLAHPEAKGHWTNEL